MANSARALLFALLSALLSALPCAAQNATLAGQLTNLVTGAPIANAHVALSSNSRKYGAFTDASGNFTFENVVPDSYELTAEHAGYRALADGDGVKILPGVRPDALNLKLTPLGSIAGRILDRDGEPMEGISVSVHRGFSTYPAAVTDEKGQFRLVELPPGKYRILAQKGNDASPPEIRTDGTVEVNYGNAWYPGVLEAKSAAKVEVRPGSETEGIEIRMVAVPIVRVSGRIEGLPAGASDLDLSIAHSNFAGGSLFIHGDRFEVWRLDPGHYRFSLSGSIGLSGTRFQTAAEDVDVADSNIDNLVLRVVPPVNITGRVDFEDARTKQKAPQPKVMLTDLDNEDGNTLTASPADDGSFRLENAAASRYRVRIAEGAYLKSMRLGQTDIEGTVLDLRRAGASAELSLLLSSTMGSIAGAVRDETGMPCKAWVALIPTDSQPESEDPGGSSFSFSFPATQTKDDGAYAFAGIAPGSYKLIAAAKPIDIDPSDDDEEGEEIEIRAGEKTSKDLTRRPQ